MSAVSVPKPDDAPDPASGSASDADGWALLEALRRRLDDQAALGRKTAAQVTQLADSIAALVAQQRRRSLWLNVNSFVAYLVFTILCGAGSYLLYRSRAHELTAARAQAAVERDAAVRHADEATVRAVAREATDTKAWEVYQLLEAGKRAEAITKLEALRDQPLSKTERAVLAARVHATQVMEVEAALKAAVAAFKAGRPGEVIRPLEAALTGEPPGARGATIHYYLGVAYARTKLDKAISHLQAAIAGDVDQDDARFQLASVLDRSGAYALARAEYDRFATAHPQSQLAVFAMRRSATLARLPAVAPSSVSRPRGMAMPPPAVPSPAGAPGLIAPAAATSLAPATSHAPSTIPAAPPPGSAGPVPRAAPGAVVPPAGGARVWPRPAGKPVVPPQPPAVKPASPASGPSDAAAPPSAPSKPPATNSAPPPGEPAVPAADPPPTAQ